MRRAIVLFSKWNFIVVIWRKQEDVAECFAERASVCHKPLPMLQNNEIPQEQPFAPQAPRLITLGAGVYFRVKYENATGSFALLATGRDSDCNVLPMYVLLTLLWCEFSPNKLAEIIGRMNGK